VSGADVTLKRSWLSCACRRAATALSADVECVERTRVHSLLPFKQGSASIQEDMPLLLMESICGLCEVRKGLGQCDDCWRASDMPPVLSRKRVGVPKVPYAAPKYARQVFERAGASAQAKSKAGLAKGCSVAPTTPSKSTPSKSVGNSAAAPVIRKRKPAALQPAPLLFLSPLQRDARAAPTFQQAAGKPAPAPAPASPRLEVVEGESPPPTPHSKSTAARSPSAAAAVEASAFAASSLSASAPSLPASSKSTSARPVSSRKNEKGVALSHAALLVLVRELNATTDKQFQLKNLRQCTLLQLDAWLDLQADRAAAASVASQIKQHALRLTQPIHREVCMRMLMLIATRPALLALYQDSCAGTSRTQLDAGSKPTVNAGQGMGLNHAYWVSMVALFNDDTIVSDFPFDYFVPHDMVVMHSDAVTHVPTPPTIEGGLFEGLGLKQPRLSEGFPDGFFDIATLHKIFTAGLNEYHNATSRFHQSGQHGRPFWFFVSPIKTVKPEEQADYLQLAVKRWDSLAFQLLFEQVHELQNIFTKAIPGGKGGPPCDTSGAPPAGSSARVASAHKKGQYDELHTLQVSALRDKQRARDFAGDTSTLSKIRDSLKLLKDFEDLDDTDMVAHCKQTVAALKATLPLMSPPSSVTSLAPSSTPNYTP